MRWMKAVSLISRDTDDWVRVGSGSGSGQVRSQHLDECGESGQSRVCCGQGGGASSQIKAGVQVQHGRRWLVGVLFSPLPVRVELFRRNPSENDIQLDDIGKHGLFLLSCVL